MPGYYKNVMVATTANDGLIQANPINIYTVVLDDDKNICGYKKTDYTFMRITIPLQENVPEGIFPMGAAFESDIKKKEFVESIDFGLIQMYQTIPYSQWIYQKAILLVLKHFPYTCFTQSAV